MCLAQDNDVVHAFTPDRSDQPFDEAILPGRGRCDRLVPDAHGAQSACHDGAVDPIAVSDHVTRSPVPRKGLGYLTCNPLRCRVGCDVNPNEISAIQQDDDEGIEQVETDSWNNEQVHGSNVWRVVMQESPPSLAGRRPSFDHVWTGRAVQAGCDDLEIIGLAHLYSAHCRERFLLPGHHGYPRASDLIRDKALEGRKYIKITDATVRPFLHFLNPTRRPRQESFGFVAVYLSGPSWTLPRWFQACLITPPLRPAAQREPHSDVPAPRQSRRSAPACWRAQLPEHCGAIAALRR